MRPMKPVSQSHLTPCTDCGHHCSSAAPSCPNCGKPFEHASGGDPKAWDNVCTQVLSQSSLKVGMCLTLLGLIRVIEGVKNVSSFVDELLALNAVLFLVSGHYSYIALKETDGSKKLLLGKKGDRLFTASVCLLAVICAILTFELL